ncbi:MAG: hypothetical protein SPL73_02400 [Cyanobacteriota bacterium]|nr:hypothetical protein [Cyanobacteriota bacterium]MDY6358624.1 hypothetical protein [Cyanobacteriota bacterium]MDY6363721.1 hypothetical protein [Cyanobacteriota bacterium]MDY6382783.1 hypothetical protein [Cyanobacteriota bacterium]
MELIEIRNNLIKLSYTEEEKPTLGHFIALTSGDKSYVAQYVNLKADNMNNFAVARLMFTFNSEGVVSEFDGSIPSIHCKIVQLPANELLDLLPIETPVQIGKIVGTDEMLSIDISVFEHNFTVFCENDYEKSTLISNCVRQLFRMKEKSIVIDTESFFEDYPNITLGTDFKLPLNSDFIDFVYENEMSDVDASTKAVIQDVFYAVEQYMNTLEDKFIPIDTFIDVVTAQYKETQMPELALLKNRLLKYRDEKIFANNAQEIKALENKLYERNCVVINVKNVDPKLQKELILYVHKLLEKSDKYVYYFVPLTDDNSDKKLIKRLINHNHVFTTIFASHLYKYESELKSHAQNIMLFAPQTMQHDFAAYNTFLNKLNPTEGIIYGNLTQGIPLIVDLFDLDLDLTKDDVFGDREIFIPAIEDVSEPEISTQTQAAVQEDISELPVDDEDNSNDEADISDIEIDNDENEHEPSVQEEVEETQNQDMQSVSEHPTEVTLPPIKNEEPIENILSDDYDKDEITPEPTQVPTVEEDNSQNDDDLDFMDEFTSDDEGNNSDEGDDLTDELTEEDLDYIEENNNQEHDNSQDNQPQENEDEQVPMVPVFDTGDKTSDEDFGFAQGDEVQHPRYGKGVVEKIIKYGNKTLCSINFENVGRRLLDPSVTEFEKI